MGRLIPAGTGMDYYRSMKLESDKDEVDEVFEEEDMLEPAALSSHTEAAD